MRLTIFLAGAVMMAALGGCTTSRGQFTRPNYDTIYNGEDVHAVWDIMGKPQRQLTDRGVLEDDTPYYKALRARLALQTVDRWVYEHDTPYYKAIVYFSPDDCKVIGKEWKDSRDAAATQPATSNADQDKTKHKTKPKHKAKPKSRNKPPSTQPQPAATSQPE